MKTTAELNAHANQSQLSAKLSVIDAMLADLQSENHTRAFPDGSVDPEEGEIHAWWPTGSDGGYFVWNGGW